MRNERWFRIGVSIVFTFGAALVIHFCAGCDKYDWSATLAKLAACAAQSVTPRTTGGEETTPTLQPWPDAGTEAGP